MAARGRSVRRFRTLPGRRGTMAQERADHLSGPDIPIDTDSMGEISVATEEAALSEREIATESKRDLGSVDNLLALTGEGWDIDEQVRTLKRTADDGKPRTSESAQKAALPKAPGLIIPTPYDFGASPAP